MCCVTEITLKMETELMAAKALELIPKGSSVGWGGCMTVEQIGLLDAVRAGEYTAIDRATGKTPEEVEKGLQKAIPKQDWSKAHHLLIYHGRRVCHSRKPDCEHCALNGVCDEFNKK